MKYTIFCLLFMHSLSAQNELVTMPDFFSKEGVILSSSNEGSPSFSSFPGLYDVTREDVYKAESLLSLFDYQNRKFRKKSFRQYLGYTDNNQRYILINVLRMNKGDMHGLFKNWKNDLILPFTEFGEEVNLLYKVNIDQEVIGFY